MLVEALPKLGLWRNSVSLLSGMKPGVRCLGKSLALIVVLSHAKYPISSRGDGQTTSHLEFLDIRHMQGEWPARSVVLWRCMSDQTVTAESIVVSLSISVRRADTFLDHWFFRFN